LLTKKGCNSGGSGIGLNAFSEVWKHRKRDEIIKWNPYQADSVSDFVLKWSELPSSGGRASGMESSNRGWCPRFM